MSDAFVSLLSGKDTTSCGTHASPCRTISYAIHLVSAGSIIYLDGTGTSWQRAYTCQPLRKEPDEGIYVAKNISFISTGSRAHIACSQENFWMVDGSGRKGGIQDFKLISKDLHLQIHLLTSSTLQLALKTVRFERQNYQR